MKINLRYLFIYSILFTCMLLTSCNEIERPLIFVGDSNIERWDLSQYFPSIKCQNKGVSGSRLNSLLNETKYISQDIVVMIGTNDLNIDTDISLYVQNYVKIIKDLSANKVYLYSILPRRNGKYSKEINQIIIDVNFQIKKGLEPSKNIIYLDVYNLFLDKNGELASELSFDGLHLNNYGYDILASELIEKIR